MSNKTCLSITQFQPDHRRLCQQWNRVVLICYFTTVNFILAVMRFYMTSIIVVPCEDFIARDEPEPRRTLLRIGTILIRIAFPAVVYIPLAIKAEYDAMRMLIHHFRCSEHLSALTGQKVCSSLCKTFFIGTIFPLFRTANVATAVVSGYIFTDIHPTLPNYYRSCLGILIPTCAFETIAFIFVVFCAIETYDLEYWYRKKLGRQGFPPKQWKQFK